MPEATAPPPLPKSQPSFGKRHSTIIKLLGVGALVLVLLIPLMMITGVLNDRLMRRNEAVTEITSSWGKEQSVIGPVLGIPYQYKFKAVKEITGPDGKIEKREVEETAVANAYFLPETLNLSGDAQTQMLHRGIYDAAVFRAQVKLSGKFAPPDFGALKIDIKDVQWKDAFVTIAVNDLRGTREGIVLDWGGTKRPLLPGSQVPGYTTGATAMLGGDRPISAPVEFSIPLDFNGSEGIYFLMRTGRFPITVAIIRNRGRAETGTNVLRAKPFRNRFSARTFCRSWTRIATSNARSNTACSFSCSCSRRFSSSKLPRGKRSIRWNI